MAVRTPRELAPASSTRRSQRRTSRVAVRTWYRFRPRDGLTTRIGVLHVWPFARGLSIRRSQRRTSRVAVRTRTSGVRPQPRRGRSQRRTSSVAVRTHYGGMAWASVRPLATENFSCGCSHDLLPGYVSSGCWRLATENIACGRSHLARSLLLVWSFARSANLLRVWPFALRSASIADLGSMTNRD